MAATATTTAAAIATAGTAIVLAPITPQAVRGVIADLDAAAETPTAPAPVSDEALVARVRTALGLPWWRPNHEHGESETRIVVWSPRELNDLYERVGGTVASRQVEHTSSDGRTWVEEEITLTIEVPGIGPVQALTGWCEDLDRTELPVMRALDTPEPRVIEVVPGRGQALGYTRYEIAPGAPLPDGRTITTVEDPLGSSWRVTDDQGRVHYLHKHGQLRRYTTGVVAFVEPEWSGWACD